MGKRRKKEEKSRAEGDEKNRKRAENATGR